MQYAFYYLRRVVRYMFDVTLGLFMLLFFPSLAVRLEKRALDMMTEAYFDPAYGYKELEIPQIYPLDFPPEPNPPNGGLPIQAASSLM